MSLSLKKLSHNCRPGEMITAMSLTLLLFISCATPSIRVTQEQNRGDFSFNNHDYTEAAEHYGLMLESSRKLGIYRNLSMEALVHRKIANCHEMTGNYDEALFHVHEAMKLDSTDNNLLGRIENYRHEGRIFIYLGSYRKGIISIERSIELSEKMEQSLKNVNRLTLADNYLALGQLYAVIGKPDMSFDYLNKALKVFRQAGDRRGEMEALLSLGSAWSDIGDIINSESCINESLKIAVDIKAGTARHYQILSGIYSSLGEYEDALRNQERALEEAKKVRIEGQIIWATVGMGDVYRQLGDPDRAERYYREASEIKESTVADARSLTASLDMRLGDLTGASEYFNEEGSVTGSAISSLRISELLLEEGKPDSALYFLDQAGTLFKRSGNLQGSANVHLLKGKVMVDRDDHESAMQLLDSARQAVDFPEIEWQAWFHLGRSHEKRGKDQEAIESYRNAISVIEKIRGNLTTDEFKSIFFDSKREVYDRLIRLLNKNNMVTEAFQVSEQARARAFYDILSNRRINFRGAASDDLMLLEQEKRIEMQKLYKLLQKSYSGVKEEGGARSGDASQIRKTLAAVQAEYEEILRKIKLNNPSYAEMITATPVSLPDIQSRIDPSTAALEYWISNNELIIWFISYSEIVSRKVTITSEYINSLVENTRKQLESNSLEEMKAGLKELYGILISPFKKEISGYANLLIIPNQSLHFIPYQALIDEDGDYMVQKFNIVYAPSAGVFRICNDRIIKRGSRFMGMALADVPVGNNPGLPGTEDELKKILPLFPDNMATFGKESTESFVRKNAGNFNILHFATHGSYNYQQPLYSFLLFPPDDTDDGRLNVFEIFELELNAKLVTLSACETGLGNISQGDELTGLSRAFLFAGSSSVIVSLWSVADYPTAMLMTNFYSYLKEHSMQEALTLAQRDVLKEYNQPVYWAPFILIGNGNLTSD